MPLLGSLAGRVSSLRSDSASESESEDDEREYDIRQARCEVHRRKIGLKLDKKLRNVNVDGADTKQEELIEYIRNTFTMRECMKYVPKKAAKSNQLATSVPCHCGGLLEEHWIGRSTQGRSSGRSSRASDFGTGSSLPALAGIAGASTPRSGNLVLTPRVTQDLLLQRQSRQSRRGHTIFPAVGNEKAGRLPPLEGGEESILSRQESGTSGEPASSSGNPSTVASSVERALMRVADQARMVEETGRSIGSPSNSPKEGRRQLEEEEWDEATAFCDLPTNAFGKVEFANDEARSKPAKYIRLHHHTDMETVIQLLIKMRMMDPHRPSLAISVIGGAKNFSLDGKKKETFNRGLVKAAQTTNAWILTGGSNMGIMRTVGEAVRDGQSMHVAGHQRVTHALRCIGIGSWGYVQNRADLVCSDGAGLWPGTYHVDPVVRHGRPVSLDPNHTHFLLVDDGYRNQFRPNVADFRARLERHIAAPALRDHRGETGGGLGIPVVVVLVEGGLDSIDFAYESLRRRVPVVLCQGTGRAADILAYAFNHHVSQPSEDGSSTTRILPDAQRTVLLEKLRAAYGKTMQGSSRYRLDILDERLALISKCCQEEDLITVFDINRDEDLDLAILAGLLKGRGASRLDQLRLSLKWNRPDVAEEKIFTDSAVWEWGQLEEVMTEALALGRTDFVRLLLQHGVVMRDFLTVRRLRFLYNQAGRGSFLRRLLASSSGGQTRFLLHHVKSVLERLLERNVEDVYSLDVADDVKDTVEENRQLDEILSPISEARFQKPFKELFLWAVLMNRPTMARFFWERGDSPVMSGLVATKVYHSLAQMVTDEGSELSRFFRTQKTEFEGLSMAVLEQAFNLDPEKALLILERPHTHWGKVSSLEMAASASDKRFMATPCSQNSIDQTWKRGLASHAFPIVVAVFFPLYVLKLQFDSSSIGVEGSELSCAQKFRVFYNSPITKFATFTLSYVIFLALYTYFVLFQLHKSWQTVEILLHLWVFTILASNVHDIMLNFVRVPSEYRLRFHIWTQMKMSNFWWKTEILGLLCHLVGFIMRLMPSYIPPDVERIVFCLAVIFFYLRLFRVYMASSYLGPKLFVINRMVEDVIMFMLILIVFMMAYAVGLQALLFPERDFYWGIFKDILYHPYWQMYGELNLEETISGNLEGCDGNGTQNAYGQWCPRKFWPSALLLAVYLLIVNILLVNLLIAVFTHIFDEVQANSTQIWKFELWKLATEFDRKATLPPPLAVLEHAYVSLRYLFCCGPCGKLPPTDYAVPLTRKQLENLHIFEKECMNEFLRQSEAAKKTDYAHRIRLTQERVEWMAKRLEEERSLNLQREALQHFARPKESLLNNTLNLARGSFAPALLPSPVKIETGTQTDEMGQGESSTVTKRHRSSQRSRSGETKELKRLQERIAELEAMANRLPPS